jgi:hypothetical protein
MTENRKIAGLTPIVLRLSIHRGFDLWDFTHER